MKGVILAAGKGSRLYPVTHVIPKPLLPLANRLTLEYAFDQLKSLDVTDICLVVGENEPKMRAALGDGSGFGVKLSYVVQTEPKGLAHALGFAKDFVAGEDFVLYLGDAIYGGSFVPFKKQFEEGGCANLSLVKKVPDPSRFGVANLEGDRIVKLVEKPKEPQSDMAMAGTYFFGPQIWGVLPSLPPSARGEYEITDAIQALINNGETVLAGFFEGEWFDSGTLDSYLEVSEYLTKGESLVAGEVTGTVGPKTVVGEGATVECTSIEDSVILPGAKVKVTGAIRHAVLAGPVERDGDLVGEIVHGDWKG